MNWAEFFAMGGRAFYVWGSYGMALFIFIVEIILVRHRKNIAVQQLRLMKNVGKEE